MSGLLGGTFALSDTLDRYLEDYGCPDLFVSVNLGDASAAKTLENIPGVSKVSARLTAPAQFATKTQNDLSAHLISLFETDFQTFHVWNESESDALPNVYLDCDFARDNGILAGDTVTITVNAETLAEKTPFAALVKGNYSLEVNVGKIVSAPETLGSAPIDNYPTEIMNFGTVYVPASVLAELATKIFPVKIDVSKYCNQIVLLLEKGADTDAVSAAVKTALGERALSVTKLEESAIQKRIDSNVDPFMRLSIALPTFFLIVVLVILFLFMTITVKICRREIGILRALGFTKGSIRGLFAVAALVMFLLSALLGTGIGWIVIRIMASYFRDFFPLPFFDAKINLPTSALSLFATLAILQAAALFGTSIVSRIQPTEAMSRSAPDSAKVPLLVKKCKNLSPLTKFNLSSLLRNPKRFLVAAFCTAACTAIIFAGFGFSASKNFILQELFERRLRYDAQVFLSGSPEEEWYGKIAALPSVSALEKTVYLVTTVEKDGKTERCTLSGVAPDTKMIRLTNESGKDIPVPENGIVLEQKTAKRLNAKKGDVVTVNGFPLTVTDISYEGSFYIEYVSLSQAEALDSAPVRGLLCNVTDKQAFSDAITKEKPYFFCSFTSTMNASMHGLFKTFDLATWIVDIFALLVGFVVAINLNQNNLLERKRELCIMRLLGFPFGEISRKWFGQSVLQCAAGLLFGLPLGVVSTKLLLFLISTPTREYAYASGPKEFLLTFALILVYLFVSHTIAMFSVKRWNLPENTKEKE